MRKIIYLISILTILSFSCSNELNINSITVYPENVTIIEGDSMRINAVIDFSGGKPNEPDLIKLTWYSDNNDIVSVDTTGYIRSHTIGIAHITVACENKSAHCTVTVIEDTTTVEESPKNNIDSDIK